MNFDHKSLPGAQVVQTPKCWIRILDVDSLLYSFRLATRSFELPIALSQVCRQWRDIVLHTPTMWAQIRVLEELGFEDLHFVRTLHRVYHALKRSRGCRVSITIYIKTLYHKSNPMHWEENPFQEEFAQFRAHTRQLSRFISMHAARVQKLVIFADELPSIYDIQKFLPGIPMPLLEYCFISHGFEQPAFQDDTLDLEEFEDQTPVGILLCPESEEGIEEGETVASLYPKLNNVHISSIPLAWTRFSPRNLQTLSLADLWHNGQICGSDLRDLLLANAHSLQYLSFEGAVLPDSTESYVMPNVRRLSLGYENPKEVVPLLLSMKVPNLQALHLKDLSRAAVSLQFRRQIFFVVSIDLLLTALIDNVPLHKLTALSLECVRFLPYRRYLGKNNLTYKWVDNLHNLPIPSLLFHFMSSMTSLEMLTLSDPDFPTLFCLNYHPPSSHLLAGLAETLTSAPVPRLLCLELDTFNLRLVQQFIALRLTTVANPRSLLSELHLTMPRSWRSRLRFNMSLVAERIYRVDKECRLDIDEATLMLPYE
jgi:hypothetical protein